MNKKYKKRLFVLFFSLLFVIIIGVTYYILCKTRTFLQEPMYDFLRIIDYDFFNNIKNIKQKNYSNQKTISYNILNSIFRSKQTAIRLGINKIDFYNIKNDKIVNLKSKNKYSANEKISCNSFKIHIYDDKKLIDNIYNGINNELYTQTSFDIYIYQSNGLLINSKHFNDIDVVDNTSYITVQNFIYNNILDKVNNNSITKYIMYDILKMINNNVKYNIYSNLIKDYIITIYVKDRKKNVVHNFECNYLINHLLFYSLRKYLNSDIINKFDSINNFIIDMPIDFNMLCNIRNEQNMFLSRNADNIKNDYSCNKYKYILNNFIRQYWKMYNVYPWYVLIDKELILIEYLGQYEIDILDIDNNNILGVFDSCNTVEDIKTQILSKLDIVSEDKVILSESDDIDILEYMSFKYNINNMFLYNAIMYIKNNNFCKKYYMSDGLYILIYNKKYVTIMICYFGDMISDNELILNKVKRIFLDNQ